MVNSIRCFSHTRTRGQGRFGSCGDMFVLHISKTTNVEIQSVFPFAHPPTTYLYSRLIAVTCPLCLPPMPTDALVCDAAAIIGPRLHHLHLSGCHRVLNTNHRQLVAKVLRACPRVEELVVPHTVLLTKGVIAGARTHLAAALEVEAAATSESSSSTSASSSTLVAASSKRGGVIAKQKQTQTQTQTQTRGFADRGGGGGESGENRREANARFTHAIGVLGGIANTIVRQVCVCVCVCVYVCAQMSWEKCCSRVFHLISFVIPRIIVYLSLSPSISFLLPLCHPPDSSHPRHFHQRRDADRRNRSHIIARIPAQCTDRISAARAANVAGTYLNRWRPDSSHPRIIC
jgi:hypothetical protein